MEISCKSSIILDFGSVYITISITCIDVYQKSENVSRPIVNIKLRVGLIRILVDLCIDIMFQRLAFHNNLQEEWNRLSCPETIQDLINNDETILASFSRYLSERAVRER